MVNGKDILVELRTGERYGFADVKTAQRVYPDAKIIGYQNGQPWDGDQPVKTSSKKAAKKRSSEPTRAELNVIAAEKGVESPESLPNIAAAKAAIAAADAGTDATEPAA